MLLLFLYSLVLHIRMIAQNTVFFFSFQTKFPKLSKEKCLPRREHGHPMTSSLWFGSSWLFFSAEKATFGSKSQYTVQFKSLYGQRMWLCTVQSEHIWTSFGAQFGSLEERVKAKFTFWLQDITWRKLKFRLFQNFGLKVEIWENLKFNGAKRTGDGSCENKNFVSIFVLDSFLFV